MVSLRIHFAVLAHANEPCVADLVRCLWDLNPGSEVSVFNGGRDPRFFKGQGVPVCPNSTPLRYGNLTAFHYGVMRWLAEERRSYDFLVTMDHDMLPMRSGLADYLAGRLPDLGYIGARFREANDPAGWTLGGSTVEQICAHWAERWQPLFGSEIPYWAFNPGQVFTRPLVERILAGPTIEPLMDLATRSRIWAMEEVVYPTLAVAAGAHTESWEGERALVFDGHSPDEMREFALDPAVFFVHRVGMQLRSPDRLAVHEILKGLPHVPEAPEPDPAAPTPVPSWITARRRARGYLRKRYNAWHVEHRA